MPAGTLCTSGVWNVNKTEISGIGEFGAHRPTRHPQVVGILVLPQLDGAEGFYRLSRRRSALIYYY